MKLVALLSLMLLVAAPEGKARKTYASDPVFVFENGLPEDVRGNGSSFSLRRTQGWIRSRRVYDDFLLEFQFRARDKSTAAAIALRMPVQEGAWADKGYVLWLSGGNAGKLLARGATAGKAASEFPAYAASVNRWHSVKVTCEGTKLSVVFDNERERSFDVTQTTAPIVLFAGGGAVDFQKIVVHEMEQIVDSNPPAPPGVFRPEEVTALPKVVREVKPRYTHGAMLRKARGSVHVGAIVLEDGSVGDVSVIKRLDPDLDEEAMAAVKKWQFKPATRDGKPVPVLVEIELTFTLR